MTRVVRFQRAELEYGCHRRSFELDRKNSPTLVYGPNGSGKSTLIEGIVRSLYGFHRRSEGTLHKERTPWDAITYRGCLTLKVGGEEWEVDRDFVSAEVTLRRPREGKEVWAGDGNPGASNVQAREYRERLAGLIGIPEREGYERTGCVHQSELLRTEITDDLLRVAAGGHGTVEQAKQAVARQYEKITVEPIRPGVSTKRKDRDLETVQGKIDEHREDLDRAETSELRRRPLVQEREESERTLERLTAEVEALEKAQGPLSERRARESEQERLVHTLQPMETVRADLGEGLAKLERSQEEWRAFPEQDRYPEDFLERLAELRTRWESRERLRAERNEAKASLEEHRVPGSASFIVWTVAGTVAAAAALGGYLQGWLSAPEAGALGVVAVLGWGLAGTLWAGRRGAVWEHAERSEELAVTQRELAAEEGTISERLAGVPAADTLSPDTFRDRREEFERQRRARRRLEVAHEALRPLLQRAGELSGEDELADPEQARSRLDEAIFRTRSELAQAGLALEKTGAEALQLPEGVPADPEAVGQALRKRRDDCAGLTARLRELDRQLLDEASPPESSVALRDRIAALEEERDELRRKADAHRRAYALIADAYEEFRSRDQDRLLASISERLRDLTGGLLGPLEAPAGLAETTLHGYGRDLVPHSPPLSYGEYHAVLLAVRMGAADFLAKEGIIPPLLVDEPFAHLDEERAAEVWRLLEQISRERQVIVTTQDRLLLEQLGVEPDLELERCGPQPPS
ncbi:MAG: AAA family ATPase [Longimicrobiaceae bacterium]